MPAAVAGFEREIEDQPELPNFEKYCGAKDDFQTTDAKVNQKLQSGFATQPAVPSCCLRSRPT
jgi:hypothetical protein